MFNAILLELFKMFIVITLGFVFYKVSRINPFK